MPTYADAGGTMDLRIWGCGAVPLEIAPMYADIPVSGSVNAPCRRERATAPCTTPTRKSRNTDPCDTLTPFLLEMGRVLFIQDGFSTGGEISTGEGMIYAGLSGASSVVFGGRTYLCPNVLDYYPGEIIGHNNPAQSTARYYTPITQPTNWTPQTDGYTMITFALGQYSSAGPNTRVYQCLAINSQNPNVGTTPHWLLHGQDTDGSNQYAERVRVQGANGNLVGQDIETMFAVDNGAWSGGSLGPVAWGWGTVSDGTVKQTFWQHNDGTVEFNAPLGAGSSYTQAFPPSPCVHLFIHGETTYGTSSDAQIAGSIIVPYGMTQAQIQATFDGWNAGLSLSVSPCPPSRRRKVRAACENITRKTD